VIVIGKVSFPPLSDFKQLIRIIGIKSRNFFIFYIFFYIFTIMNTIKKILIFKIIGQYRHLKEKYKHDGFFYFENPKSKINRIGSGLLYKSEEILPINWDNVKGKNLYQIYREINQNNFYFYKNINGKSYKTRPKK